ncbi:MAG TPA: GNAT family protein [Candidatus Elarobacter sp.]|jgi:RimJ/RimL family protein N-acetyltransferase|nr:GNAT family protein [Candidatus Elarobacter sp.]
MERMAVQPVTLRRDTVVLEPLSPAHAGGLARAGLDPELWRWIPSAVTTEDEMRAYVELALDEQRRGVSLPFAIVDARSGAPIGSTRYGNIVPEHRRLEIGWTWIAPAFQRTAVNTEAKLLLLTHAFETLGTNRVEFKTDALNERSRAALLRIGATQEGIFRRHMVCDSGRLRDSVYFSIVREEWPDVKERLLALSLRARTAGTPSP